MDNELAISIAWWNESTEDARKSMLQSLVDQGKHVTAAEAWNQFGRADYLHGWRPQPDVLREAEGIVAAGPEAAIKVKHAP